MKNKFKKNTISKTQMKKVTGGMNKQELVSAIAEKAGLTSGGWLLRQIGMKKKVFKTVLSTKELNNVKGGAHPKHKISKQCRDDQTSG